LIRIAGVGDVHYHRDSAGELRDHLDGLAAVADVLLIAGDVTSHGHPDEARAFATDLVRVEVPVVAVLGNHDYHLDAQDEIADVLSGAGAHVLEGSSVTVNAGAGRVAVGGIKGFGGGFVGASGSDFGEPEMKAFVRHTKEAAARLERALASSHGDVTVALLHYSPVEATLQGERLEIYPFLGSYLLAEAIDRSGADLVLHGHAHRGSRDGVTPGGVPVRNVALSVIAEPFRVFHCG
jgi:Icc-related predicted phosphoesterase